MPKFPGSLWIEGNTLRYVSQGGSEWNFTGVFVENRVAYPGSLWIEGADIHYINQAGSQEYKVVGPALGPSPGWGGSLWVEGNFLHWIREDVGTEHWGHQDVTHGDGGGGSAHIDHNDQTAYQDAPPGGHFDVPHQDDHIDNPHQDFHTDSHVDIPHSDQAHGDAMEPNYPYGGTVTYQHDDCQPLHRGAPVNHQDHNDNPTTLYLCYWHDDIAYNDAPPQTAHGDQPHQDRPSESGHLDAPHSDTPAGAHTDVPHGDTPHGDHSDAAHLDTPHFDNPTEIGP